MVLVLNNFRKSFFKTAFCCCFLSFFFGINESYGQQIQHRDWGFESSFMSGYHLASNNISKTGQSLNGIPYGIEISWVQNGTKKDSFNYFFAFPRLAISARLVQINKPDTFGYCLGIFPSFSIPIKTTSRFRLASKIGFGLNLNSMQYNINTNFDNRAISSPINFCLDVGGEAIFQVKPKINLKIGAGLYHVSNGSLKMPNGGINLLYAQTGIAYFPNTTNNWNGKPTHFKLSQRKWNYSIGLAGGYRELGYFDNINYFWVATVNNQFHYQVNRLYSIGIGLDGFFDATQPLLNEKNLRLSEISTNRKFYLGSGIYQQFTIGKFFIPIGVYYYLAPKLEIKEPIYIRFGPGWQFHKKLYTGIFFKGTINRKNQLQSDFMEWTIGYKIW